MVERKLRKYYSITEDSKTAIAEVLRRRDLALEAVDGEGQRSIEDIGAGN